MLGAGALPSFAWHRMCQWVRSTASVACRYRSCNSSAVHAVWILTRFPMPPSIHYLGGFHIITREDIEATIEKIRLALKRLYRLAEHATDDETIDELAAQMNGLEKQKRDAEMLLFHFEETNEQEEELEKEILRFEQWTESVRPQLTNPDDEPSYQDLRLA